MKNIIDFRSSSVLLCLTLLICTGFSSSAYSGFINDQSKYFKLSDDMYLDKRDDAHKHYIEYLQHREAAPKGIVTFGAAVPDIAKKWPNGEVHYYLANSITPTIERQLRTVMKHIEIVSKVRFIQHSTNGNYRIEIYYTPGRDSSSASLGYSKHPTIQLNTSNYGVILHEFFHALGFIHEHQRGDRDSYVSINYAHIPEDINIQYNFEKLDGYKTLTPYDYDSIMHYGAYAFSKNGSPTINAYGNFIGNRSGFSEGDKKSLIAFYGKSRPFKITLKNTNSSLEFLSPGQNGSPIGLIDSGLRIVPKTEQTFLIEHVEANYFKIINSKFNTALDVSDVSQGNYASVHQWKFVGGSNQMWRIENSGDISKGSTYSDLFHLTARHSNKVLDYSTVTFWWNNIPLNYSTLVQNDYQTSRASTQNWRVSKPFILSLPISPIF